MFRSVSSEFWVFCSFCSVGRKASIHPPIRPFIHPSIPMLRQFRAGLSKATVPGSAPQPLRSIRYPLNISLGRFSGWQKFRNLSHDRSPRTGRSCFASTSTSGSSSASSSPASAPGQQQPQKSAQDKGSGFIERPSQNLHLLPEELLQKPAFKHAIWSVCRLSV